MARMEVALDVTDRKSSASSWKTHLRPEDLILSCVKILHEMRHINEAVEATL